MKTRRLLALAGAMLLPIWTSTVHAADFRSVGDAPASLYDAPSQKGRKVFVAPRAMPVEVVLTYGDWVKVRDAGGGMSWAEAKALTPQRLVVVRAAGAHAASSSDSLLIVATSVAGLRPLVERLRAAKHALPNLVWLCKGFEENTRLLPHQVVRSILGNGIAAGVLSGPSFAQEVERDMQ